MKNLEMMQNGINEQDEVKVELRLRKVFARKAHESAVVVALPQPGAVDLIRERQQLKAEKLQ